jgi:hypothetical protein
VSVLELRRLSPSAHMCPGHLQDSSVGSGLILPVTWKFPWCVFGLVSQHTGFWFVVCLGRVGRNAWGSCSQRRWASCTAVWGLHSLVGPAKCVCFMQVPLLPWFGGLAHDCAQVAASVASFRLRAVHAAWFALFSSPLPWSVRYMLRNYV